MDKFFTSAAAFRRWLQTNHATVKELSVGFYRKALGRGLTYSDALDEALCFGWIDGVRRNLNEDAYTIRFTPRKPGSHWSAVNITRATALESQGRMSASGLRAFRGRDEKKTRQYSYERERARFTPALNAALRANPKAAAFFDAQPPGYRKLVTFWVMSAKKDETRERRMTQLIERSARGSRLVG